MSFAPDGPGDETNGRLALCWLIDVWLVRYRGRVRAEDDNKLRRAAKTIIDRGV